MKEEKELIDVIVDKLKNIKEPEYKSGSWEKFKMQQASKPTMYRSPKVWYAAASVLLCLGIVAGLWFLDGDESTLGHQTAQTVVSDNTGDLQDARPSQQADGVAESNMRPNTDNLVVTNVASTDGAVAEGNRRTTNMLERLEEEVELQGREDVSIPQLAYLPGRGVDYGKDSNIDYVESTLNPENTVLANSVIHSQHALTMKSSENLAQNTNIRLSDRFELGLFISPYATSHQMNVGGGLAVSYKLNKILSLRTGASYNNYEIQMVKNPIEESSTEAVVAESNMAMANDDSRVSQYQNKMIIPNINAITGFVKSVDIPLEIKVNDARNSFYATAGMSYSAILNQQRNAHYIENMNIETFADGYPENREEAYEVVKPITRVIESTEENVNTSGFSGFVNFSVGKNVRINKKVGFSVEPYLKIPVGQYRRAETDYTNGGIRVMTNF